MEKLKTYCGRRFSRENVLVRLSKYSTRILVAAVWCAVLWAFLTNDALPRQYLEYLMSRNPGPCVQSSVELSAEHRDQLFTLLPPAWNTTEYQLLSLSSDTDSSTNMSTYQVLLVRQSSMCLNILEFKGYTLVPRPRNLTEVGSGDSSGDSEGPFSTESVSTQTLDVLSYLYPENTYSLLDVPDGHFFALTFLLIVSSVFGVFAKWLLLPQLVGMIIAGIMLKNVPGIDFARHISNTWSSTIRNIALIVVLLRGGLSMDFQQLKRLKFAVLLLAFGPCVLEGAVDGVLALFWLQLPWQFAFTLGYTVAAISPSVVVPTTLHLESMGYGKESGIPTLIVGAASMDVVISISLFGVFLGLSFSDGSLVLDIFRAPIQIVIGLAYGALSGILLWVFPTKHFKKGSKVRNRFFLTLGLGLFAYFGSTRAIIGGSNLSGSGALGALVMAFVAAQGWKKEEKKLVSRAFFVTWQYIEPLLFGLIGAALDLRFVSSSLVAIGLVLVGLVCRVSLSYVAVLGNKFNWHEMVLVSIAWLSKATVQAAIASTVLDLGLAMGDETVIDYGRQILTVAVLAVIMTAPLGAVATSLLGPVLLTKASPDGSVEEGADGSRPPDEVDHHDSPPPTQDIISAAIGAGALPAEPDLHGRAGSYSVTIDVYESRESAASTPSVRSRDSTPDHTSVRSRDSTPDHTPPDTTPAVESHETKSHDSPSTAASNRDSPISEPAPLRNVPPVTKPSSSQPVLANGGPPGLGVNGSKPAHSRAVKSSQSLTNHASGGGDVELKDMVIADMDSEPRRYLNRTIF